MTWCVRKTVGRGVTWVFSDWSQGFDDVVAAERRASADDDSAALLQHASEEILQLNELVAALQATPSLPAGHPSPTQRDLAC